MLFAFLGRIVDLIDENVDQNLQVALLPSEGLNEILQFLFRGAALPMTIRQGGANALVRAPRQAGKVSSRLMRG